MPARPAIKLQPAQLKPPTDKQISLYVAEMCAELRQLAKHQRFRTTRYLLDMARLEAERTGKDLPG